jgi:hypothetical protein
MADKMSIDNKDPAKDDSGDESTGSSPEAEHQSSTNNPPQENQQPKRKGGRKPVRSQCLLLMLSGATAIFAVANKPSARE